MQRVKPRMSRGTAVLILIAALAAAGLLTWGILSLVQGQQTTGVTATRLPCPYDENIKAFGNNVLYYDGMSIHCMSATGAVRWSFQLGTNAGFDCDGEHIAAWVGSTVYILDQNGNSSYNDNLGEEVQFCRIGKQYLGAVVGETDSPRLLVKDMAGAHMDEEADAYKNLILLDLGFYGPNGEYMWTLALDVFGTAANSILNTFEVGKMNTGEVSLGDAITYKVLFENGRLRVFNTRQLYTYDYKGVQDTNATMLVYGWKLIDAYISAKGDAKLLMAPTAQTNTGTDISELRLLMGSVDRRYTLPSACVGAAVYDNAIYAFSETYLYKTDINTQQFYAYEIPSPDGSSVTSFLGLLSGGRALVACGDTVYSVTLPE